MTGGSAFDPKGTDGEDGEDAMRDKGGDGSSRRVWSLVEDVVADRAVHGSARDPRGRHGDEISLRNPDDSTTVRLRDEKLVICSYQHDEMDARHCSVLSKGETRLGGNESILV
jgi:hypothetical protein